MAKGSRTVPCRPGWRLAAFGAALAAAGPGAATLPAAARQAPEVALAAPMAAQATGGEAAEGNAARGDGAHGDGAHRDGAHRDGAAGRWRLTYDAWLAGMLIVSVEVDLSVAPDRYVIRTSGQTRGFADLLVGWRGEALSSGNREGDAVDPDRHSSQGQWGRRAREAWVDFAPGGEVRFGVDPPPDPEEREPVPAALAQGTVDPLSAFVAAGLRGAVAEDPVAAACRGEKRLFDGNRRYDARLEPAAEIVLAPMEFALYHGPARRCMVTVDPIAGFWKRDEEDADRSYVDDPHLWLARVDGMPFVLPVRLQGDTALGTLMVHLSSLAPAEGPVDAGPGKRAAGPAREGR